MHIKLATDADFGGVFSLLRSVYGCEFEASFEQELSEKLLEDLDWALIVEVDGEIAGCILLHQDRSTCLLHSLAVATEHREKKFATELIQAAKVADLPPSRPGQIWAAVAVDGIWEQKRYEALGFEEVHPPLPPEFEHMASDFKFLCFKCDDEQQTEPVQHARSVRATG